MKKIGLALGGGFVKGAAHVGVLKVLEENNIRPHMIAGTSAGSMVAALYASGWTVKGLERLVLNLKPTMFIDEFAAVENLFRMSFKLLFDLFRIPVPFRSPLGLMRGAKLTNFIRANLGHLQFESAPVELAITAVDIRCGTKVIFLSHHTRSRMLPVQDQVFVTGVDLWEAVRASTAVPGVFEPKCIGGYVLVDGGLRENVPAKVLKAMGADTVLAVDLGINGDGCKDMNNIIDVMVQTVDIIRADALEYVLDGNADVRIRPRLEGVGSWDFYKVPDIIAQGEQAARDMLPEILKVCGKS